MARVFHVQAMPSSLLVQSVLVVLLASSSLQQTVPQAARAPMPGYQGLGTGQGFRPQGTQGVQGYPADGRYGFEIVDTADRYGYVSTYPGGRTSFFLLGPNRGPGQQSNWRGSSMGNTVSYQPTTYRPNVYSPDSYRPNSYRPDSYRPVANGLDSWRQPGAW